MVCLADCLMVLLVSCFLCWFGSGCDACRVVFVGWVGCYCAVDFAFDCVFCGGKFVLRKLVE